MAECRASILDQDVFSSFLNLRTLSVTKPSRIPEVFRNRQDVTLNFEFPTMVDPPAACRGFKSIQFFTPQLFLLITHIHVIIMSLSKISYLT